MRPRLNAVVRRNRNGTEHSERGSMKVLFIPTRPAIEETRRKETKIRRKFPSKMAITDGVAGLRIPERFGDGSRMNRTRDVPVRAIRLGEVGGLQKGKNSERIARFGKSSALD